MQNEIAFKIIQSWGCLDSPITTTLEILDWVKILNANVHVEISKIGLCDSATWSYDEFTGTICNANQGFFSITGCQKKMDNILLCEQPIILQDEIGYLGVICKDLGGVLHFLMQAKIEPGNVNKIQISPTIQATKSNFSQRHGGRKPAYLDYFINANRYDIIVDQIQSEQSSRFYKKRNRNIIICIEEDIEVFPSHRWMTLGQIKQLMKFDNIVNMDTRTVLSSIPFSQFQFDKHQKQEIYNCLTDKALYRSIFEGDGINHFPEIYQYINNYKMFDANCTSLIPLFDLKSWEMSGTEFFCKNAYPFKVVFCDISIEGREVKHWTQPLFEALGMATFGLIMSEINGVKMFLVRASTEIGCFDKMELGPTLQVEADEYIETQDIIAAFFMSKRKEKNCVRYDVILSEEGGRFYQEQNYNIILEVPHTEVPPLPEGYFWADYKILNTLIQVNNCLNIQLRNLLSLLEV